MTFIAEYKIQNTEEYVVTSILRSRQKSASRFLRWPIKLVCYAGLSLLLLILIIGRAYLPSALIGAFIILLAAGPKLDYWIVSWRFRRSHLRNRLTHITITSEGYVWEDDFGKGELKWFGFLKTCRFKDGFLLYYTKQVIIWLPNTSLSSGTISDIEKILHTNIAVYEFD